ncbi:helix-turn-helix domain-containing protein [Epibacterium ulvae]|nr:helix-turn-helix domain-containing protein [Epibacterium ulvae]
MAREGTPKAQIARNLGVSRMTVYRALADAET